MRGDGLKNRIFTALLDKQFLFIIHGDNHRTVGFCAKRKALTALATDADPIVWAPENLCAARAW